MALETLSSGEFSSSFIVYDNLSATPPCSSHNNSSVTNLLLLEEECHQHDDPAASFVDDEVIGQRQGRIKRRRKTKICKNKEEIETQRMTHIAVERNRRKQMNEHLASLRALMPQAYVQRGDQASIVGGAIEFVKELENLAQSLEAQKFKLLHQGVPQASEDIAISKFTRLPFANFFVYPQYTLSLAPNKYTSQTKEAIADIEVTLIKTHANLRILLRRSFRKLSKLLAGFQTLCLTILHLNVITIDPFILYSISAKVEEGCQLGSVNDIATAVHHLLRMIDDEASHC